MYNSLTCHYKMKSMRDGQKFAQMLMDYPLVSG